MEFFSGCSGGEIIWWDLRNLEKPIETLLLYPTALEDGIAKSEQRAFGVVALEYESTIPNKCKFINFKYFSLEKCQNSIYL